MLEAGSIQLKDLPQAEASSSSSSSADVYQLCVCEGGELFLAPPSTGCAETDYCS